jgi:hypothetical protein
MSTFKLCEAAVTHESGQDLSGAAVARASFRTLLAFLPEKEKRLTLSSA